LYYDKSTEILNYHFKLYEQSEKLVENKRLIEVHNFMFELPKTLNRLLKSIPLRYINSKLVESYMASTRKEFSLAESLINDVDKLLIKYPREKNNVKYLYYSVNAELAMQKREFIKAGLFLDSVIQQLQARNNWTGLIPVYNQKSYVLSQEGRIQDAIELVKSKMVSAPNDFIAKYLRQTRLVQLYFESGQFKDVLSICDSAYHTYLNDGNYGALKENRIIWSNLTPDYIKNVLYFLCYEFKSLVKMGGQDMIRDQRQDCLRLFNLFNEGLVYLQERNFSEEGKIAQEIEFYPLYETAIRLASEEYQINKNDQSIQNLINWSEAHKSITLRNCIIQKYEIREAHLQSPLAAVLEQQNEIERTKVKILSTQKENKKEDSLQLGLLKSTLFELEADLDILQGNNKELLQKIYNPTERMEYPMAEILNYLKENQAQLIDYFVGDEYLVATLISSDGKYNYSKKLSLRDKNNMDVFIQYSSQRAVQLELEAVTKEMYNLLLAPFEKNLTSEHLIVIPDGLLFKIPFEMLVDSAGEPMIKKHSIHYEFSSKLLLQKSNTNARYFYSGFAPEYSGKENIQVTETQAKTLEGFYSESRATLGPLNFNIPEVLEGAKIMNGLSFVGKDVDKQTFKNNANDSRIVHLAMHAVADNQNPDYSQLFFRSKQGNEPLFAYELNEYSMNTELAILSACNTGVGRYRRGDGVQSLARAFKSAGCKNVLMSL